MHYVSTAERQIIKLSSNYILSFNLSSMIKCKVIYMSDGIKWKHKKEELINLRFSFLELIYYVRTTERQVIKLSSKYKQL